MKILVAYDGSEPARRAMRFAAGLARRLPGSELEVLYVAEDFRVAGLTGEQYLDPSTWERLERDMLEYGRKVTEEAAALAEEAGVEALTKVRQGNAAAEIVAEAQSRGVDLIVMGTRGLNALGEIVLGSVSVRVMRQAGCPVTVVR
ncbi:MAG: universal stress protein [Clostridia bacterium]|nr:universal stress protein [Clostridia bacterium]MCL6522019.1 universal stress protein [Bacillota bacterium]